MGTAVDLARGLDAVANDRALAVRTTRRHGVNGTLEAVERHGSVLTRDAKGIVIVITADVAFGHGTLLSREEYLTPQRSIASWVPRPLTLQALQSRNNFGSEILATAPKPAQ
jgi:hypothetical protein